MILGWDFSIAAIIVILSLIPLYFYRDKIYRFIYGPSNLDQFLDFARIHLKNTYPKIPFVFDKILIETKMEPNEKTRAILIAENLLSQYIAFEYNPNTRPPLDHDLIWTNYRENCIPNKDKLPSDWSKRKEFTWQRDNRGCLRCGQQISLDDARVTLLKPLEEGGQYNFENLQTLCLDCYKIVHSKNSNHHPKTFIFLEKLLEKIK